MLSWFVVDSSEAVLLGLNPNAPQRSALVPNLAWIDNEIINVRDGIEYHAKVLDICVIQLPSTIAMKLWDGQNDSEHDYFLSNSLVETVVCGAVCSRNLALFTLSPTLPRAFALHTAHIQSTHALGYYLFCRLLCWSMPPLWQWRREKRVPHDSI
jgi:hypothetical protein